MTNIEYLFLNFSAPINCFITKHWFVVLDARLSDLLITLFVSISLLGLEFLNSIALLSFFIFLHKKMHFISIKPKYAKITLASNITLQHV
jgi:hypothetical protein